jgi:hypothetical protein
MTSIAGVIGLSHLSRVMGYVLGTVAMVASALGSFYFSAKGFSGLDARGRKIGKDAAYSVAVLGLITLVLCAIG